MLNDKPLRLYNSRGDHAPANGAPDSPELTRHQPLAEWNATAAPYPRDRCMHQLFEQQAEQTPDAVAVVFGSDRLSYRELNRRSNQLANYIRKLGGAPDAPVGICLDRSLEMIVGLLGILKAGGAYVPLDPAYPRDRLDFILGDTRAGIVLTQAKLRGVLPSDSGVLCLDAEWHRIEEEDDENPNLSISAENLAYVMYTSGSTGTPKGVEIPHRGVVRLLFGTSYVTLSADEVFLQLAPLGFDASTFEIWGALLHGARLVLMPPHQPTLEEIGQAVRNHKISTLWLTAGLFHLMVEERVADLRPLRQLLAGGDILSATSMRRAWQELPGCRLINGYGPTESTTFACCYSVGSDTDWDRPIPIGRPIANTQIYILDTDLKPVPVGVTGELCIGGDGLARGYVNRPEMTAEKFITPPFSTEEGPRIYRTGDLACYRPDGNIDFLGRIDRQVKIRGFRIELEEIEAALQQHKGVSQCVVVAKPEADEKLLNAYVVPVDPDSAPATTALRDFLKQRLPDYMMPATFTILPYLPVTPNGKIDRIALPQPDRLLSGIGLDEQFVAPRTAVELRLARIWARLLDATSVSVRDNFFDLGGHSLLAVQLLNDVHKSFNRSLSLPMFFQNPTIEKMARALEYHTPGRPELVPLMPGDTPGSLFFLDAGLGHCRLAQLLNGGPASFATFVPLPSSAYRAANLGKMSKSPTLEDIAAAHADLVRSQQLPGPCLLAGYSFGGLLAIEVAHQLQRDGRRVDIIFLLDAWASMPPWWQRLRPVTLDHARKWFRLRASRLRSLARARARNGVDLLTRALGSHPAAEPVTEHVNQEFEEVVLWVYINAMKNYRCHPLDCRAVLFRSHDDLSTARTIDATQGWDGLFTRGLQIVDVPGDHDSLLLAPHLLTTANRLQRCLEEIGYAHPRVSTGIESQATKAIRPELQV